MVTAVPAVITIRSPLSTRPAERAASTAVDQSAPTSLLSGISSGVTPPPRASWRIAQSTCVSAMIGRRGRSRATAFAVRPLGASATLLYFGPRVQMIRTAYTVNYGYGASDQSVKETDWVYGLAVGGEHFLSEHFSIGVDEVDDAPYEEVHRQIILIINVLISVVCVAVF